MKMEGPGGDSTLLTESEKTPRRRAVQAAAIAVLLLGAGTCGAAAPLAHAAVKAHVRDGVLAGGIMSSAVEAASALPAATPLQPLLDRTSAGGTVAVPAGAYSGPVVIDRPLQVRADGAVTITGSVGDQPVVDIRTSGASFSGFSVKDDRFSANLAAIAVEGDNNRIEDNAISSYMHGVMLRGAGGNVIRSNRIAGLFNEFTKDELMIRGNGVDIRENSNGNRVEGNTITDKQDGVYAEKSEGTIMERNTVSRSRYALHVMFTENSVLRNNDGQHNVVGAIVMSTAGTQVLDNRFTKQSDNVNAEGLLIYDVKNGVVRNNLIEGNRTGLQLDQTNGAVLEGNRFQSNFIGITITAAEQNVLQGNEFIGNVVDAQAEEGLINKVKGNYWDQAGGIDLSGSGHSGLPYEVNPFFLKLTGIYPAFQLFFDAPGMLLLEQMFKGDTGRWLHDSSPLMKPLENSTASGSGAAEHRVGLEPAVSAILLLFGGIIIYRLGVVRR